MQQPVITSPVKTFLQSVGTNLKIFEVLCITQKWKLQFLEPIFTRKFESFTFSLSIQCQSSGKIRKKNKVNIHNTWYANVVGNLLLSKLIKYVSHSILQCHISLFLSFGKLLSKFCDLIRLITLVSLLLRFQMIIPRSRWSKSRFRDLHLVTIFT